MKSEKICYAKLIRPIAQIVKDLNLTVLSASESCIVLSKYGSEVCSFNFSYNESKIYFTMGLIKERVINEVKSIEAISDGLDQVLSVFNKAIEEVEL